MKLSKNNSELPGDVDPDESEPLDIRGAQVPLEVDPHSYGKPGEVRMVMAPGGVLVAPGEPAQPVDALTEDSFICAGTSTRPVCTSYAALLMPAEGTVKGFKQPMQIRRFCTRLAAQSELLELTDCSVYACTLRTPQDAVSVARIAAFETEQRKIAEESAQKSGQLEL